MSQAIEFVNSSGFESSRLAVREIVAYITIYGNTNEPSIKAGTDTTGVIPYVENGAQPTPADSGANFGTLDSNTDPSTIGILALTGNAGRIIDAYVPFQSISSGTMFTGSVTKVGLSSTGITASGNIALVITCSGLEIDKSITNHSFNVVIQYLCLPVSGS